MNNSLKSYFVTTQLFMSIPLFYFYHYISASICTLINLDKAYCNVLIFFIPRKNFNKYHIPGGRSGEGRETEVEKEEEQRERQIENRGNDSDVETNKLSLRWRERRISTLKKNKNKNQDKWLLYE